MSMQANIEMNIHNLSGQNRADQELDKSADNIQYCFASPQTVPQIPTVKAESPVKDDPGWVYCWSFCCFCCWPLSCFCCWLNAQFIHPAKDQPRMKRAAKVTLVCFIFVVLVIVIPITVDYELRSANERLRSTYAIRTESCKTIGTVEYYGRPAGQSNRELYGRKNVFQFCTCDYCVNDSNGDLFLIGSGPASDWIAIVDKLKSAGSPIALSNPGFNPLKEIKGACQTSWLAEAIKCLQHGPGKYASCDIVMDKNVDNVIGEGSLPAVPFIFLAPSFEKTTKWDTALAAVTASNGASVVTTDNGSKFKEILNKKNSFYCRQPESIISDLPSVSDAEAFANKLKSYRPEGFGSTLKDALTSNGGPTAYMNENCYLSI
jgi:hypothetical protein